MIANAPPQGVFQVDELKADGHRQIPLGAPGGNMVAARMAACGTKGALDFIATAARKPSAILRPTTRILIPSTSRTLILI